MGSLPVFARDPYNDGTSSDIPAQIDKVIGSAYDTVRLVAENIEYIKHVSANLPQIYRVAASADAIDAILESITLIDTIYQNLNDILLVATNITPIKAVGNNITAVTNVSNHMTELLNISSNLLAILSVVRDFTDRNALKTYIAANPATTTGRVYTAGERQYVCLAGSTLISDLPGLIVLGRVTPFHFGAKGDGIVDDTAACNAAIAYCFNRWAGGEVYLGGGRWLIDSGHLVMRAGVTIRGDWRNLAETVSAAPNSGRPWLWTKSTIVLNPLYTIVMNDDSCGIEGLGIFPKNLSNPVNTARGYIDIIKAWTGKAITVGVPPSGYTSSPGASGNGGAESWISHVFIVGFEWAIYSDFAGRTRYEWIYGDNKNGIFLSRSYDMQHLSHCHFWPFYGRPSTTPTYIINNVTNNGSNAIRITLTDAANPIIDGDTVTVSGVAGTIEANNTWEVTKINTTQYDLIGSTFTHAYSGGGTAVISPYTEFGIGYDFNVDVDWGQADTCFCFGYNIGFRVLDAGTTCFMNIGVDQTSTFQHRTAIGILVTGGTKANRAKFIGCRTAAGGQGIVINTAPSVVTTIIGHTSWGIHGFNNGDLKLGSGISVLKGKAIIQGSMFWDLDKCIYIDPASDGAYISGNCNTGATSTTIVAPDGPGKRMSTVTNNAWIDSASTFGEQFSSTAGHRLFHYDYYNSDNAGINHVFRKAAGTQASPLPPKNNDSVLGITGQVWDGVDTYRTIGAYRVQLKEANGASPTQLGGMHIWSTVPLAADLATGSVPWDALALTHTHLYPLHHAFMQLGHASSYWDKTYTRMLYLADNLPLVSEPTTVAGQAAIWVNDQGDLKVKFGDGTVKTIVTD
jgi:Pectate lyase superfamily protein